MVAPLVLAGIGAGASALGGLLGEWWASASDKERAALEKRAADLYGDASAPSLQSVLAEQLGPSALDGVKVDEQSRGARRDALQRLMQVGSSGGMDEESRLAMEQARRETAQQERSQRGAIMANARARGVAGSGLEMASQLQAQQGAADRNSLAGMQGASDARRRALQALSQGADIAGGLERDDYSQQAGRAAAADRIAQFNASQRTDATRFNTQLEQQRFDNDMRVRDAKAQALQRQADLKGGVSDRRLKIAGGVGQGAGFGLLSAGLQKP